jgi:hypothetical protein
VAPHSCLAFLGGRQGHPDGTAERGPVPAGRAPQALVRSARSAAGTVSGLWQGNGAAVYCCVEIRTKSRRWRGLPEYIYFFFPAGILMSRASPCIRTAALTSLPTSLTARTDLGTATRLVGPCAEINR